MQAWMMGEQGAARPSFKRAKRIAYRVYQAAQARDAQVRPSLVHSPLEPRLRISAL